MGELGLCASLMAQTVSCAPTTKGTVWDSQVMASLCSTRTRSPHLWWLCLPREGVGPNEGCHLRKEKIQLIIFWAKVSHPIMFETYLCGWVVTQCQRQERCPAVSLSLPPLAWILAGQYLLSHLLMLPVHIAQGKTGEKSPSMGTYINDDAFVQQALLLGRHDKVVGTVLVVNNVLEINPWKEKHSDSVYQPVPCFIPALIMYVQKRHIREIRKT